MMYTTIVSNRWSLKQNSWIVVDSDSDCLPELQILLMGKSSWLEHLTAYRSHGWGYLMRDYILTLTCLGVRITSYITKTVFTLPRYSHRVPNTPASFAASVRNQIAIAPAFWFHILWPMYSFYEGGFMGGDQVDDSWTPLRISTQSQAIVNIFKRGSLEGLLVHFWIIDLSKTVGLLLRDLVGDLPP